MQCATCNDKATLHVYWQTSEGVQRHAFCDPCTHHVYDVISRPSGKKMGFGGTEAHLTFSMEPLEKEHIEYFLSLDKYF